MKPLNRFASSMRFAVFSFAALAAAATLQAQNNPPTNSLALWVKADAGVTTGANGVVDTWADQSGNGNDAAQTDDAAKPTLVENAVNGRPVVRFDGASDFLDVPNVGGLDIIGDIASFAVIRVDDYSTFNSIWGKTAGAANNIPAPNDWYLSSGSGQPQFFRGDGTAFGSVGGSRPIRTNAYAVVGVRQSGTTVTHYLNGATNGVGEITVTPADAGTNLKIGSREDLFTKMNGDIAELLIYTEALSDSQVTTAIEYLRNKYGITNTPPIATISAPANNASVAAPAVVTVTVNASDPDGAVTQVTLLANGAPVATATAAPFQFPVVLQTAGTVAFTAVVTDDRDSTATSTNVTVTVTSTTTPTLNTNPNLQLWLRGDAGTTVENGVVTQWQDQSGKNNHAVQSIDPALAPTLGSLNGQPALHFGGDDYLDVADSESLSITGDLATFFVARFEDYATFRAVWGKTTGNQPQPADYYLGSGSGVPSFLRGGVDDQGANAVQGVGAAGSIPAMTPVVLGVQQSGSNVTHYLRGAPFGTGVITIAPTDADTELKVGTRGDYVTQMKGEIAELLIYSAALSSNDLVNVQQYLAAKYNIPQFSLSNALPTVQVTGPTAGTNLTAPGPFTLTATASDAGGSVSRVEFFVDGVNVGSDTTAPYTATFSTAFPGPANITAVAVDNLGGRRTSSAVTVNIVGGQVAPIPTGGLALWLRPDEGVLTNASGAVTTWEDSSGNGNDAIQTDETMAPLFEPGTLNGLPTLNFDGVDDSLTVATSPTVEITGNVSSFFVVNVTDYDTFRAIWAKTTVNLPAANDFYLVSGNGLPRFYHGNGTGSGIGQVTGILPFPTGEFVTAGFQLADGTASHYLNGEDNGSGPLSFQGVDAGTALMVGTRADGVTRFKGSFAELLIYGRAVTDAERAQIEAYFQSKYFGQTNTQPSLTVTRGENNALVFSWPESAEGFTLEATPALGTNANWTAVTEPVVPANGQNTVTVQPSGTARFFRLRKA